MNNIRKPVITARNLSKHFGPVQPVREVNFTVQAGEFITLLGPSGSGKSTLLGLIAGLEQPSEGNIHLQGSEITNLNEDELALFRREHVGFVFQAFHLIPTLNSLENVAFPLYPVRMQEQERTDRAMDLLEKVGLGDRAAHPPARLSGGERQRVAIARALINQPDVVLADEPSGNLDATNSLELHELFFKLREHFGQTFVIVTHDPILAEKSDRIIHLKDGKVMG